jgi:hypothetical protein
MQQSTGYSILKVVAYFDLFNYPVTRDEIHHFLDQPASQYELNREIDLLTSHGHLIRLGEFYALKNDPSMVEKRLMDNERARKLLTIANKLSRFLFQFPFVRGIGISGSLSKNIADERADIDYFIITSGNKLWIARTLLHAFKKLSFITGHQHWFCMNYFIDEAELKIEEKNFFTAIELITLLPVCGDQCMETFFGANDWSKDYFPNHQVRPTAYIPSKKRISFKKAIEWLFSNKAGGWLDNYFMRLTTSRWNDKEAKKKLNIKGNRMGLKTGKHYSKPNPVHFQHKVLIRYENSLHELANNFRDAEMLNSGRMAVDR